MIKLFGYFISKSFLLLALLESVSFNASIWFVDFYREFYGISSVGEFSAAPTHLASFYTLIKGHRTRWLAQATMWIALLGTGWYYWP